MTFGSHLARAFGRAKRREHHKRFLLGLGATALVAGLGLYTAAFYLLSPSTLASLGPSGILTILVVWLAFHEKTSAHRGR